HEALYAGLPIVLFDKSGGMPDFLKRHKMGTVVPHADAAAMARALGAILRKGSSDAARKKRRDFVETELNFDRYVESLLKLTMPELPKVSVAIPNYNYERYLPERLGSVFMQTHPLHEIVVLDDCSADNSLVVIRETVQSSNRRVTLLTNEQNSGSVFKQWRKAAESCSGEFLWMAEADDLSDPSFLSSLLDLMRGDRSIVMGFTDSRAIDSDGNPMWSSYKPYCAQRPGEELPSSRVFKGEEFVRGHLAVRNLILNVSAVVWRREALLRALKACQRELAELRMAGDWRLYLEALAEPGAHIAYVAENLNAHRRHASSVTHALQADRHIAEIAACHKLVIEKFKLNSETKERQKNYLEEVSLQLRPVQNKGIVASGRKADVSKTSNYRKRRSR
ncbi:MAG: glycosyltransferase, partial [Acidobacteria bacterium]|nr:glycosyltransferase [Acidobacteriota bacterium]